jgi:hypothetical protein
VATGCRGASKATRSVDDVAPPAFRGTGATRAADDFAAPADEVGKAAVLDDAVQPVERTIPAREGAKAADEGSGAAGHALDVVEGAAAGLDDTSNEEGE